MARKRETILLGCLVGFAVYAVLTGGVVISNYKDFAGTTSIGLEDNLTLQISLVPQSSLWVLPFVFGYHGTGEPFGIQLWLSGDSQQYQAIQITQLLVEYRDGGVVRMPKTWSRSLWSDKQEDVMGGPLPKIFRIEGLVLRHAANKITLKGHMIKVNGERAAFEASETFRAQWTLRIQTLWESHGEF